MRRFAPWMLLVSLVGCCAIAAAAQRDESRALRIVSLAPNLTELAFAAGAGEVIVGTVEYSDYPEAARRIQRVGDAFRVDFERVLALQPDMVLAWQPGTPSAVIERLKTLQLNVATIKTHRIADIGQAVREIGRIAGTSATAGAAAARFEREIDALRREYGKRPAISVFLQVNDRPLYTVNGKQIMSEVLALCGGRNVFAQLNDLAPQVGIEAVIAVNPQVIISTGDEQSEAFTQWRRWPHIDAVRAGNLYALPPDDLARSTTRLVGGAQAMCRTLETARDRLRGAH